MGSFIEINDTLQITKEQGFPEVLKYETHKNNPITTEQVQGKVFEFKGKKGIRIYKTPPVRNFLAENINGKWLYWGLIHIIEINHNPIDNTTSGKFIITHIYSPEEMLFAHRILDRNKSTDYLNVLP